MDRDCFFISPEGKSEAYHDACRNLSAHSDLLRALQQWNLVMSQELRDGIVNTERKLDALHFAEHVLHQHGLPQTWSLHAK